MYKVTSVSFIQEDPSLIKKFQMSSRNLWNDHAWRIRNYIVSTLAMAPDAETASKWVEDNVASLSAVVKLYYGQEAADKFSGIIDSIFSKIASKVDAIKMGETISSIKQDDIDTLNELAVFLDTANPIYWKREEVSPILQKMFAMWINQIMARSASEWDMDLKYTDEIHDELLKFADIFSAGIIAQFPNSFSTGVQNVL